MSRDWLLFLEDMCQSTERIRRQTTGRSFESWIADEVLFDATVRNLTVLGEAAKQVPEYVLVHAYYGLKPEILWNVVESELPGLSVRLRAILQAEESVEET